MKKTTCKTALWIPAWHAMDQQITSGETFEFWFYAQFPQDIKRDESVDFLFYNVRSKPGEFEVRRCTIDFIEHPMLGLIDEILTDGLDYGFSLSDGREFIVNAEENPGRVENHDIKVDDWSVTVRMSDVSEPIELDD